MLINFSVTNFGPINEQQTLSMEAVSSASEALNKNLIPGKANKSSHLRSLAIYGPNAAGKSTLIKALAFLKKFVLESHKQQVADPILDDLEIIPFKLDPNTVPKPSEFEIEFLADGMRYRYGVCCTARQVTEEWLFAYPKRTGQKWFHRVFDTTSKKYAYKYSTFFELDSRSKTVWEGETKSNELFLSLAVQRNNQQFLPMFEWFKNTLQILDSLDALDNVYTKHAVVNDKKGSEIIKFMQYADLRISDLNINKLPFHAKILPVEMPTELKKEIADQLKGKFKLEASFTHQLGEHSMQLSEEEESRGTQAMFAFAGPWLDVLENSRVLVVDELDTSLHPLVVHRLVELFHHQGHQSNNTAQLIFTTHDATLLAQKLLRRDQIWFVEKNRTGATELYSLADINDVRDDAAHSKAYLNGRYGGIPFMKALIDDGQ